MPKAAVAKQAAMSFPFLTSAATAPPLAPPAPAPPPLTHTHNKVTLCILHSAFLWLFLAYAHNGSGASCLHVLCIFTLIENVVAD